MVALFTRAWIEIIDNISDLSHLISVALFTRAWIEIAGCKTNFVEVSSRPLHEGVD